MGLKWEDVLKLAAVGVASGMVPKLKDKPELQAGVAKSITAAANMLEGRHENDSPNDELQKSWVKMAKRLAKEKNLDDDARISWLKPKVRADLYLRDGKMPGDNEVTVLAEGAVALAKAENL